MITRSCDPVSNFKIFRFDTDRGSGSGRGRGGRPGRRGQGGGGRRIHGRGGHGVTPQDTVDSCNHITKSYYHAVQYSRFIAAEKQKICQKNGKKPRSDSDNTGDNSSIKELNVHIRQLSAVIKIQNKRIHLIETKNGNEDPLDLGDDKSVLNIPNRDNPYLGRQVQGSTKRKKGGVLLLNTSPVLVCLQTFRKVHVGPCATLLLSVEFNDLETNLELDSHADTS